MSTSIYYLNKTHKKLPRKGLLSKISLLMGSNTKNTQPHCILTRNTKSKSLQLLLLLGLILSTI